MTQTADKAAKPKNKFMTGTHPGLWNWLLSADTRFSEHGTYGTDLVMYIDDAKSLVLQVQDIAKADIAKVRSEHPETREWKVVWPIKDYDGDDDALRGLKVVSFRQKVNPQYNFSVDVFDAKKKQLAPGSLRIGNMTKLRVSFYVRVVKDQLNKCVRVIFHPRAAQIIELVPWEADYGFDEQEGFTAGNGDAKGAPKNISDMRPGKTEAEDPFADEGTGGPGEPVFDDSDIPFAPNRC